MGESVAVLGAGVMGTALGLALDRAGSSVAICGTEFDAEVLESINKKGRHPGLEQAIPRSIRLLGADQWPEALEEAGIVWVAVSSEGLRTTVETASSLVAPEAVWAVVTKGWERESTKPVSAVVAEAGPAHPVVVVAGPSVAAEVAAGDPTAMVCASADEQASARVAAALRSAALRVFTNDDVAGVEVGSALKNVLAIAIGMCDGIGEAEGKPMTNTKAALFSRGLIEMGRLATALGGRRETVLGLAGAGDLFVTALGGRNGRFGRLVGGGLDPEQAMKQMGTTVEGYANTSSALALARKMHLDLPIVEMVHAVLYEGTSAVKAVESFMDGSVGPEL